MLPISPFFPAGKAMPSKSERLARSGRGRSSSAPSSNGTRAGVGAHGTPIAKARTGIAGFDDVTHGGLPAGRPTLVCGGAGCGKTLLGVEFLVRGATEF